MTRIVLLTAFIISTFYSVCSFGAVGTPVFGLGPSSLRCKGAGTVNYTATASSSISLTYSLDGASLVGGNSIVSSSGAVTFAAGWSGTTTITVIAKGVGSSATATHTVYIGLPNELPVFSCCTLTTRCQKEDFFYYDLTNFYKFSSLTWSLDALSLSAGNSMQDFMVNYKAGWTGESVITVSGKSCNGSINTGQLTTNTIAVVSPVFAIGSTSVRCQGVGNVTYTATISNNAILKYSLDAASIHGGNSVVSSTGVVTYAAGWSGTSVITVSSESCNGPQKATHTVTVTQIPNTPTVSAAGATTFCNGGSVTLVSSAGSGNQWYKDGSAIIGATSTTYAANTSGVYTVISRVNACASVVSGGTTVTVNPTIVGSTTWNGSVNTDWANTLNWNCGGLPTSTKDVVIPSGLSRYPIINVSANANRIGISNGASLEIGTTNTLNVYGDFVNNGAFVSNSSTVVFTGASASVISGNAISTFSTLKVDKSSNAAVTVSCVVELKEKLSFGTNTTNTLSINNAGTGSFIFLSNQTSTAHIDRLAVPLPILSGSFTCQKYFPAQAGRYAFMLGVPITDAKVSALQPTKYDGSGYPINGIYITGPFTGTNTGSGLVTFASSSFIYNSTTGLYTGYPVAGGSKSDALVIGQGYRFSVRDGGSAVTKVVAKTLSVTGSLVSPGSFTFKGLVNGIGTKPFNSSVLPKGGVLGGWNLVANPYMSDIKIDLSDASKWSGSNLSNTAYVYNAATRDFSSCASGVPVENCIVPAFQSFFVQFNGTPSLTIHEQAKVITTNNSSLHRTAQASDLNYLGIKLKSTESTHVNSTFIRYVSGAEYTNDVYDGLKLGAENRSYLSDVGVYSKGVDDVFYEVNAKPYQFVSDVTELHVQLPLGDASLDFSDVANLESGYSISLYDKYSKILTDVIADSVYDFSVNADSNSTGPRFQVIFNRSDVITGTSDIQGNSAGLIVYPSPTVAGNLSLNAYGLGDKAHLYIHDMTGRLVYRFDLNVVNNTVSQIFDLTGILNAGVYTIAVNSGVNTYHQKVVIR